MHYVMYNHHFFWNLFVFLCSVWKGIGKVSFSQEALLDNIRSFMLALAEAKPEGLKGKYILKATVSSSMGPGIKLDVSSVDPSNNKFMVVL